MDDPGSQFPSADDQTYADDRRTRLHRNRLVGFFVCMSLWVVSVIPLARESMDGRDGMDGVAVYLAVGAISLAVAAVIRGIYVLLKKRQFWSPWVFLIAAILAIGGYAVQSAGEDVVPTADARARESSSGPGLGGEPNTAVPLRWP